MRAIKDNFDFLHDSLPDSLNFHFGDQFQRAQLILKNRTRAQILYAFDLLDWILCQSDHTRCLAEIERSSGYGFVNRVKVFKQIKASNQVNITESAFFTHANWSDYFAVLSLVYIAEILHTHDYLKEHGQLILETDIPRIMEWAIESMDAVGSAELYQYQEKLPVSEAKSSETELSEAESGTNNKNRKNTIKIAQFDKIRNVILCHFETKYQNSDIDSKEAALQIVADLQVDNICSGGFPNETIERWLTLYKEGIITAAC